MVYTAIQVRERMIWNESLLFQYILQIFVGMIYHSKIDLSNTQTH